MRASRALIVAVGVLGLLLPLAACSSGGGDGAGGDDPDRADDESAEAVGTASVGSDLDVYCERLAAIVEDDPFGQIFGNDDPMDAAAAFDRGQARLDELVEVAPEDLREPAVTYRAAFEGFRALILPSTTLDAGTYEQRFDDLRADTDGARAELDAQLVERCAAR